jgi:hypothetical protein
MMTYKALAGWLAFATIVFPGCDGGVPRQHDPFLGAEIHESATPIATTTPVQATVAKPALAESESEPTEFAE